LVLPDCPADAAPRKIFAIAHSDINDFGNPSDTVNFYDVTSIGQGGSNVFNTNSDNFSDPLFSAWIGYEAFFGEGGGVPAGNDEDPNAIAVNPVNGTIYMAAFDSGNGLLNNPDEIGDNQGDWDLYRIDYQKLLADFEANSRPKGTVYVIDRQPIDIFDEMDLESSPLYDGVTDGFANNIPHPDTLVTPSGLDPRPSIVVPGAIAKVGELARSPSNNLGVSFFNTEMEFVDPETLLMLDTASNLSVAGDFQIRQWKRVNTSPGFAVPDRDGADNQENTFNPANPVNNDNQTGGRNHLHEGQFVTTESWEASIIGRLGLDEGETIPATGDIFGAASDPAGFAVAKRDGVLGIWVADQDFGQSGDDLAFYEINFNNSPPTLVRKELANSAGSPFATKLGLADNPAVDPASDDGEIEFLVVDKSGNLVIGESGFFDVTAGSNTPPLGNGDETAQQSKVITVGIANYNRADSDGSGINEVVPVGGGFDLPAAYTVSANLNPTVTDDNDVVANPNQADDNADIAYDKGTGYIYYIDRDDDFFEDIYVFDPATGTLIYSELNAINPGFFNTKSQVIFLRGDVNDDGEVTGADIQLLTSAISDPTQGGKFSSAVGQEFYDLTGDGLLNNDDLNELIGILGVVPGDFDADGDVDAADLALLESGFGTTYSGSDFLTWQANFGFPAAAAASQAVPEPSICGLLCLGSLLVASRRSVRESQDAHTTRSVSE
jgi:hypothetical protein